MLYNILIDYKINCQKLSQIMEIYNVIADHYEKEIKKLIKKKSVLRINDNCSTSANTPHKNYIDDDGNDLASIISCGSSRKPQEKKEDCLIF